MRDRGSGGKYRRNGIKTKTPMVAGLEDFLQGLSDWAEVQAVNPGRICARGRNRGKGLRFSILESLSNGIRCKAISGPERQEFHITSSQPEELTKKLKQLPQFS